MLLCQLVEFFVRGQVEGVLGNLFPFICMIAEVLVFFNDDDECQLIVYVWDRIITFGVGFINKSNKYIM